MHSITIDPDALADWLTRSVSTRVLRHIDLTGEADAIARSAPVTQAALTGPERHRLIAPLAHARERLHSAQGGAWAALSPAQQVGLSRLGSEGAIATALPELGAAVAAAHGALTAGASRPLAAYNLALDLFTHAGRIALLQSLGVVSDTLYAMQTALVDDLRCRAIAEPGDFGLQIETPAIAGQHGGAHDA